MWQFPTFLRDASWRILGSTSENLTGSTELRSPEGFYLGSYDPAQNTTRDARGFIVGTGNLLTTLLPPSNQTRRF